MVDIVNCDALTMNVFPFYMGLVYLPDAVLSVELKEFNL